MYRVVKGVAFEFTHMYIIGWFPDGLDKKQIESIIKERSYQTIATMEIIDGKKQVSFPFAPAKAVDGGIDKMELEEWEEVLKTIREYVDANNL